MGSPKMTRQSLRLLAVMLQRRTEEWYGLELLRDAQLKSGTLYPLLARLEQAEWIESHIEDVDPRIEGRPRRRLYRFTRDGAQRAQVAIDEEMNALATESKTSPRLQPRIA